VVTDGNSNISGLKKQKTLENEENEEKKTI